MSLTPIDDSTTVAIDGCIYTAGQLRAAVRACRALAMAYTVADPNNGGGGSVLWEDVDAAKALADQALSDNDKIAITAQAQSHNCPMAQAVAVVVAERKKADDTEGGSAD